MKLVAYLLRVKIIEEIIYLTAFPFHKLLYTKKK